MENTRRYVTRLVVVATLILILTPLSFPALQQSYDRGPVKFTLHGAPAFEQSSSGATEPEDILPVPSPKPIQPITGPLRVLVVPVDFQAKNHTVSTQELRSLVFDTMNRFVQENSFGTANLVGDVLEWTKLPRGIDYYGQDSQLVDDRDFDGVPDSWKMLDDAVKMLDATVKFGDYDYFLVVHAGHGQESSRDPMDIWSVAFLGGLYIKSSTKGINRFAIVPETEARGAVPFGVFAHEFHHLLGLPDLYDYITRFNYMSIWSLMDRGPWNGDPPGSSPSHVEGWGKQRLGWVPQERIAFVNASMALNITVDPLEEPSTGTQLVRIPVKGGTYPEYLLVETRVQKGFDSALPQSGVIITFIDEGESRGKVRLMDATPSTETFTDGAWQVGQTFVDKRDGIAITVTAQAGDSYVVYVNRMGPAPELAVESFQPQTQEIHPGDTIQLTATIRNQGTQDASGFIVNIYINGTLLSTQTLSLAQGKSTQITITWVAEGGVFEFKIEVDPQGKIQEPTKANNQMTLTLTVGYIISIQLPLPADVLASDVEWWIKVNGVTYIFKGPGNFTLSVTNGTQILEVQPSIETGLGSRLLFVAWSDGDASNPRMLSITADTSLSPTYKAQYLVTVDPNGGQAVGGGWYDSGGPATITATTPANVVEQQSRFIFLSWSGDVTSPEPQLTITVQSALTIVANWKTQYYVTISSPFGEVPGSGWYDANSQIQLSISTPIDHGNGTRRIFLGWQGAVSGTDTTISVLVDSPKLISSNWKTQYQLTLASEYGSHSGSGWYDAGSEASYSIEPIVQVDSGTRHVFVQWTGEVASVDPSGTVLMNSPKRMEAEWKTQYNVTFGAHGLDNSTQLVVFVGNSSYTIVSPGTASDWFDADSVISPSTNSSFKVTLIQYSFLRWENSRGETVQPPFTLTAPETFIAVYSGSISPPGCFIATATYGSEVADEVQLLRNFREQVVLRTKAGAAFMRVFNSWYYSFSPQIAVQVAQSDNAKAGLRVALYPLVGTLMLSGYSYSLFAAVPEVGVIVSGLVASVLLGAVYLLPATLLLSWRVRRFRRVLPSASRALLGTTIFGLALIGIGQTLNMVAFLMLGSGFFVVGMLMLTPMAIAAFSLQRFTR